VDEERQKILLDQNIPQALCGWLRERLKGCSVEHINELGFQGKTDEFIYWWAQQNGAIIITYDEDFADARFYPMGEHYGVVRLRVWPTTIEQTQKAMQRLIDELPPNAWRKCLIIIDNEKIRVRRVK